MPIRPKAQARWSWKIAEIAGIAIHVHATFLVLIAWFAVAYWVEVRSLLQVFSGLALLLALFGCVLLHELGHALTALRFGVTTRQITLLPLGGIASLERTPEGPVQGLWITLAGPAVNVVIATGLFALLHLTGQWQPIGRLTLSEGPFLERLMLVNVSLLVFNMLPAFPMDGGRALRDLLATRMDEARATRIAATLGQAMAILFGIAGWMSNPVLVLIALFVWMGATQEARAAEVRAALRGVPVGRVMLTQFRTLAPDAPLSTVVDLVLHGAERNFVVVHEGQVVGVLTQRDLLRGLAGRGAQSRVGEAMQPVVVTVDRREPLEAVLARLDAADYTVVPVLDGERLTGLLTTDAIAEFLRIQAVLDHAA